MSTRRRVDRAFARFRDTGDPAAIAEVFDLTAPELLRVARHLVRDPHGAEDLVQTVFLVAIERRSAYQPRVGVLPWLLGILANLVRRARRTATRERDATRLPARVEAGPVERALETELSAALEEAVRGLPQPYRMVVDLHLRQGANAREIGEALGRAAGTVRTQLVRGLDHLRRALPPGLAVGAVATPAACPPGMRAAVLQAARRATGTAPAAAGAAGGWLVGMLLMKKISIAAGAAALALATWAAWPSRAADSPLPGGHVAVADELVARDEPRDPPPAPAPQRRPVAETEAPPAARPAVRAEAPSGCAVSGRAVDTRGRPLSGVRVRLRSEGGASQRAVSAADGTSSFERPVGPGRWHVEHDQFGVRLDGPELVIEKGQAAARLEIVREAEEDLSTVAGCVVDDAGLPVEGASVDIISRFVRSLTSVRTDAEGRFRIARAPGVPEDEVPLIARKEGYDKDRTKRAFPWGTTDITLTLGRPLAVEILVLDADTGAPVEDYGVRLFRDPLVGGSSSFASRLRQQGHHPGGRLRVEGVLRGPQLLRVEPRADDLAPSAFHAFPVDDGGAALQRVALHRPVDRTVRVVGAGGEPVAGCTVEVVEAIRDVPVRLDTRALEPENLNGMATSSTAREVWAEEARFLAQVGGHSEALLLFQGVTGESGEVRVAVPPGPRLAIRLWGAARPPVVHDRVDFARSSDPLVVTMAGGAVLEGLVSPLDMVRACRPSVYLIDATDPHRQFSGRGLAVREDGSFRCAGVPPGSWVMHLSFHHSGVSRLDRVGAVTGLRAGETRRVELTASHLVPGALTGRVLVDGVAAAGQKVRLSAGAPPDQGMRSSGGSLQVTAWSAVEAELDVNGCFHLDLMPGIYKVAVVRGEQGHAWIIGSARVGPGEHVERVFTWAPRRVVVRIADAEDRPVAKRAFWVQGEHALFERPLWITDDDGEFVLDPAPSGPFQLATMQDGPAQNGPGEPTVLRLPVDLTAAQTRVELRMR